MPRQTTINKCACGKRINRYASECSACFNSRMAALAAAAAAECASGFCPRCGAKLRRNLSITGWIQCSQFGAPGFRADPDKPACDFQAMTVYRP